MACRSRDESVTFDSCNRVMKGATMQNERPTLPNERRPDKSSGKGGLRFIGIELNIFATAVLIFAIGLTVILFFYFSQ